MCRGAVGRSSTGLKIPLRKHWWFPSLLSSGDRVLIDTSQRVPVPPGVFAIWDGMGLVSKRIEHEPNSDPAMVVIKSVNPEYQTYDQVV